MNKSSYRYDKFLYQIHQAILSFIEEDKIRGEEYRRLILIDEFIKIVMQSHSIDYDRCNLFMRQNFNKQSSDYLKERYK